MRHARLQVVLAVLLTGCASGPRPTDDAPKPPAACREAPSELPGASALEGAWVELEPLAAEGDERSPGMATASRPEEGAGPVLETELHGCLASPGQGAARGRAHPPLTMDDEARLRFVPLPGGALVTWRVLHSCCGSAAPEVLAGAGRITLSLAWEGAPCECRCESLVRARLALPAGRYRPRAQRPHRLDSMIEHPPVEIPPGSLRE